MSVFLSPLKSAEATSPSPEGLDVTSVTEVWGSLTDRRTAFETPPSGAGLTTVTEALPMVAISVAGMAAVNWMLLTKVVGRGLPF